MANERQSTERELTPTEVARKTLENKVFQEIVGSGEIMNNQALYGQLDVGSAKPAYDEAINGEGAREIRKNLAERLRKESENLGTYARPSVSDYDVEKDVRQQIEENKRRLSLGDLQEVIKKIAGDLYNYEVPAALRKYVPAEIEMKVQVASIEAKRKGKDSIDLKDVLTEEEIAANEVYRVLSREYNRATTLGITKGNYFSDTSQFWEAINEKYKPKEK